MRGRKMEKRVRQNRILLYVCSSLIAIAVIVLLVMRYALALKEPVFLRNCMDVVMNVHYDEDELAEMEHGYDNNIDFTVTYITDVNDSRNVESVEFLDCPELKVNVWKQSSSFGQWDMLYGNNQYNTGTIVGQYAKKVLCFDLDYKSYQLLAKPVELNRGKVLLSDGSTMEVDFGRICLLPPVPETESAILMSGSTNHQGEGEYTICEDRWDKEATLQSDLFYKLQDQLQVTCGRSIQTGPILLYPNENGEYKVDLNSETNINGRVEYKFTNDIWSLNYDCYSIRPLLTLLEENGESAATYLYEMEISRTLSSYLELVKYLYKRGAIG